MHKNAGLLSESGKQSGNELLWDDARVFLAIARVGTLSGAAKMLGLGLATASRRLERLEAALGVALFTRNQGGHSLTDDGAALVARAEALELAGHAFGAAGQGRTEQVAGHVRLATAQGVADHLIIPALPELLESNPALTVEIVTGVTTVNLHRRDADLAIRMVRPERGNVSIRRLGVLGFGLYASLDYLSRHPVSERTTSLEAEDFIGWSEGQQHLPAAQWLERTLRGRPCRLIATTLSAQLAAVRAGLGMAVLPHFLARIQGLTCVRNDIGCDQPIWLAVHADLAHSRRVRLLADFLSDLVLRQATQLR
ncbi:LysR family transcriptional regulator [Paraburkholderia sp.]|uniref:LysR family transcriptional regulator n=1 Tax=Paraburkholderia sp. TaxID=1926495 RepID=UPI0025E8C31C|nr:LysR family transcriptional regulator [Paraburkholderia sp.]